MSLCFTVAELEFVRKPALETCKNREPQLSRLEALGCGRAKPGFTLSKLHFPSAPSRTSALLRLPNPSLGILKSVTILDIYRFIAFIPGCASGVKPAFSSHFPKIQTPYFCDPLDILKII